MTDSKGTPITMGDKLKSEYGYEVIVYKSEGRTEKRIYK